MNFYIEEEDGTGALNSREETEYDPYDVSTLQATHPYQLDNRHYLLSNLCNISNITVGKVVMVYSDPFYLRVMMEIFGDFVSVAKYVFHSDSLTMNHVNEDKTISIYMLIPESGLLDYMRVFDRNYVEMMSNVPVTARVNFKAATKIFKAYAKKDRLTMTADIKENGKISEIICQCTEDDYDRIPCDMNGDEDDNLNVVNHMAKYYSGSKPTCKITMGKLSSALIKYKNSGCDQLKFTLVDDSIVIAGVKNGIPTGATKCVKGGNTSEYAGQTDEIFDAGGTSIIIQDYTITINYAKCDSWMTKVGRLSHANSIVSIYMKDGAPVVISVGISVMGFAAFSFSNDRSC